MTWHPQAEETAWTQAWDRTRRRTHWIEHGGKFYPKGTRVEQMNDRREPLPAGWARAPGTTPRRMVTPPAPGEPSVA